MTALASPPYDGETGPRPAATSQRAAITEPATAIEVQQLHKRFRRSSEPAKTLKERLLTWRQSSTHDFEALSGVEFDVKVGETFGILGHNGSGKSTLLKCMAGTIRPTHGMVRVRGSLSALLELGAGFHPDLTGRENIYLNASILGFSKQQVNNIFDEIVSFSGLADFVDSQVKHYSSGMYARLGFAVAVNLEPDVLLIDEVLAVGDEAFQQKCFDRIRRFQHEGRTICLVTHSPEAVSELCDRAIVLDHGQLVFLGPPDDAVAAYRRSLAGQAPSQLTPPDQAILPSSTQILSASIDPPADGGPEFSPGDCLVIRMRYRAEPGQLLQPRLIIHAEDGVLMVDATSADIGHSEFAASAEGTFVFTVDELPLMDGQYRATLGLQHPTGGPEAEPIQAPIYFAVKSNQTMFSRTRLALSLEATAT